VSLWRPDDGEVDPSVFAGADAVVNLAGAGVGNRRWNARYMDLIRTSRVNPTRTLVKAVTGLTSATRPALLNASAVGFYGDTGETVVNEDSPAGVGFLSDVCRAWEGATTPATEAGIRVVRLRTGLVLDGRGGLLATMLGPFRWGIGGKLGSGRQWMPWISMRDWLRAVSFALEHPEVVGPVNLVGPAPARNAAFTAALGRAIRRPAIAPIPAPVLRLVLGGFAVEALSSTRAEPAVLRRAGFTFLDHELEPTLRAVLAH
jgi:uncharacterized protein (TIGR01777 family)